MKDPEDRLTKAQRDVLLRRREALVMEVQTLKANIPGRKDPAFRHRFYVEDLKDRAKKILAIDRKLGRTS